MTGFNSNGLDYNFALTDVAKFIEEKEKRDWSPADIIDALKAVGREADLRVNRLLEAMNKHFNGKKEE